MIAAAVNVPVTGMYAVVVAIDWFLDRFRTAVNVSGDLYAAAVLTKITGIKDLDLSSSDEEGSAVGGGRGGDSGGGLGHGLGERMDNAHRV